MNSESTVHFISGKKDDVGMTQFLKTVNLKFMRNICKNLLTRYEYYEINE